MKRRGGGYRQWVWGVGFVLCGVYTLMLSGCWDRVEIENRRFAVAMAVDWSPDSYENESNGYTVTLALPVTAKDQEQGTDIKQADGATLREALARLNAETEKSIYLGQMKALILGKALAANAAMLTETVETLDHIPAIDRQMLVLAAEEEAAGILDAKAEGGREETPDADTPMPGLYLAEWYRHREKLRGETYRLDFQGLKTALNTTGRIALPTIKTQEGALLLSGAEVVRDRGVVGTLDAAETRGLLWSRDDGCLGAVVTTETGAAMTVKEHKARPLIREIGGAGGQLRCEWQIAITGETDSAITSLDRGGAETQLAAVIAAEMAHTAGKLQVGVHTDVYGLLDILRKRYYRLYRQYASDWERAFVEMEIVPRVSVRLREPAE